MSIIYSLLGLVLGIIVPVIYKKTRTVLSYVRRKIGDSNYTEIKDFVITLAGLHPEDFVEENICNILNMLDAKFGDRVSRNAIREIVDFVVVNIVGNINKPVV
jgi:uncharacterized protein YllA (UPF0747 family)